MTGTLTRCPACGSDLIGASSYWWLGGLECVIDRRCPACGREDAVKTSALAAWVLQQREERIAHTLEATADRLARGEQSVLGADRAPPAE